MVDQHTESEIYIFCNASEEAFAAVTYLRTVRKGEYLFSNINMAKNRPRLDSENTRGRAYHINKKEKILDRQLMCAELATSNSLILQTLRESQNWRDPNTHGGRRVEICAWSAEPCRLGDQIDTYVGAYHQSGLDRGTGVPKTPREGIANRPALDKRND